MRPKTNFSPCSAPNLSCPAPSTMTNTPLPAALSQAAPRRWLSATVVAVAATVCSPAAWADQLLFTSNRDGGIFQLYRMAADGSGVQRVTRTSMEATQVAWSADRSRAVFVSYVKGQPDLFVADVATGAVSQVTADAAMEATPAWSPDGKTLVFLSYRENRTLLYLANADGSHVRRLTDAVDQEESQPSFSPDGKEVLYLTIKSRTEAQVRVADVATSKTRALGAQPMAGLEGSPRWSPDGSRVAYVLAKPLTSQIMTVAADGTDRRELTPQEGRSLSPEWSPSGKQLVFLAIAPGASRLAVHTVMADGTGRKEVLGGPEEHFQAKFSADGTQLLVVKFHQGSGQIFSSKPDGSQLKRVSPGLGYDAEVLIASSAPAAKP
jgi:Tol biopolymer transport system component